MQARNKTINQLIFLKHSALFDGSLCHLLTAYYLTFQKRFQLRLYDQYFFKDMTKITLQLMVNLPIA